MRDGTRYVYPGGHFLLIPAEDIETHKANVEYSINNREVFARAYAGFIAAETGHPALMNDLGHALVAGADRLYGTQWPEAEFKHARRALQQLLRRLNWR